jgi:hypothetical protein
VYGFAGNPLPNFSGLLIASVLVVQIAIGLTLDGRYDSTVRRYALWISLYPLAYWMLSAAAAVRGTLSDCCAPPQRRPSRGRRSATTPRPGESGADEYVRCRFVGLRNAIASRRLSDYVPGC